MMDFKKKLFKHHGKDVTYEDLIAKIYNNTEEKNDQVAKIIAHLQVIVKNAGDASIIAPWIAQYLGTAVKNDENLVKLAGTIANALKERTVQNKAGSGEIPENVKQEWLRIIDNEN